MKQDLLFSVVIPTYNRPGQLAECLHALSMLEFPRERFEVLVVDDGSDLGLDDIIAPFAGRVALRFLRQANAGPAAARNTGASQAKGRFLAFTDDDCQPAADWLSTLERCFTQFPEAAITGKTLNMLPENLCATASQLLIDYLYEYFNSDPNHAEFLTSNNLALPAESFHTLGGFDTTFPHAAGEDREFCDRWLSYHSQLVFAPEAIVYHAHHLTVRTFWRQHFNYGRAAFWFHQLVAQRSGSRIHVEPFAFYLNLLKYSASQVQGARSLPITALFFVSQVANVIGFFLQYLTVTFDTKAHLPLMM